LKKKRSEQKKNAIVRLVSLLFTLSFESKKLFHPNEGITIAINENYVLFYLERTG